MTLILKFLPLVSSYNVINAKLGQKGSEFVHYAPKMVENNQNQ